MPPLVNKGDTIYVPARYLWEGRGEIIRLRQRASQYAAARGDDVYYICTYTLKSSAGDTTGVLFVQDYMARDFKDKKKAGQPVFTVEVDDSFQYGEDHAQTARFLVFHDKRHRHFQIDFVDSKLFWTDEDKWNKFVQDLGLKGGQGRGQVRDSFPEDVLRDF